MRKDSMDTREVGFRMVKVVLKHYSFNFTVQYSLIHGIFFTATTSTLIFNGMHTVSVQLNQLSISFGLD